MMPISSFFKHLIVALLCCFPAYCRAQQPGPPPTGPVSTSLGTSFSFDRLKKTALVSQNGQFQLELGQWSHPGDLYECMAGVVYVERYPGGCWWAVHNSKPVVGSSCELKLDKDGDLSMQYDGKIAWHTNTAGRGVQNLTLLDTGNLVLEGEGGQILWQSFDDDNAIFAFFSGKNFTHSTTLFSRDEEIELPDFNYPGLYGLHLSQEGRLLLYTRENESMFVYHSLGLESNITVANYVTIGDGLEFHDNLGYMIGRIGFNLEKPSHGALQSAILSQKTGNLIVFFWNGTRLVRSFNSSITACQWPLHCGEYALCDPATSFCECAPGFRSQSDGSSCSPSNPKYNLLPINVTFHPQLSPLRVKSQDECSTMCAQNITCNAALFDSNTTSCSLFPSLRTIIKGDEYSSQVMFLKISAKHSLMKGTIIGAVVGTVMLLCLTCVVLVFCVRYKRRRSEYLGQEELFLQDLPRLPPRYSLKDLHVATKDFSTKLGAGGFGSVYEGILSSTGVKVAVKKLDQGGVGQSMDQFRAEVATIGSVSHVNLVMLKGFCMEGASRLLVYEFMARGSLDRWLFRVAKHVGVEVTVLEWETRCRIALDTAKGLEYLHHQCAERIVHCDVKPENILLDEKFNAKVADFGLAKLIGSDNQSFAMTTLKGTRGYLAPEWLQHATITAKSDVFSYGVVLLELITGRRCLDAKHGYLPTWAMSIAASTTPRHNDMASIDAPHVEQALLDDRLRGTVPTASLERMVTIALWCVHSDPSARPSMASVVQMLEGLVDVTPPPLDSGANSLCPSPAIPEAYHLSLPSSPLMLTAEQSPFPTYGSWPQPKHVNYPLTILPA